MKYHAKFEREGRQWLATFTDAPGCQTFADNQNALLRAAQEALEGWLEAHLESGQVPPRPRARVAGTVAVGVPAQLATAVSVRWARTEQGLTQGALAKRAGVSQQQIAKLESPDANPSVQTLEKVARALGGHVEVTFSWLGA